MKDPLSLGSEQHGDWAENLQSIYFRSKSHLKRYWWVLLFTITVSVAYQVYLDRNKEPVFTSAAQMKVDGQWKIPETAGYVDMYSNFIGTQLELMKDNRIYERAQRRVAVTHPHLTPPVGGVSRYAAMKNRTSIFTLQASALGTKEDKTGEYVQAILNAIMEEYQNYRQEEMDRQARRMMLSIKEQLGMVEKDLNESEEKIVTFQKNYNVIDIQERGSSASSFLSQLKSRLSELQLKQRQLNSLSLEQRLKEASSRSTEEESLVTLEALEVSQVYLQSKHAYDDALAQRDEFARYLKPRHPKMMRFNRDIERLENRLSILRQQALDELQNQQKSLQAEIFNLEQAIADAETEVLEYSQRLAVYERLVAQRNRHRQLYEKLLESIQRIDISGKLQTETISVHQAATPAEESAPNPMDSLVKGFGIGVFAGGVLLFLIGSLDKRVISTEDLKRNFEDPVLGIIPKQTGVDPNSITFMEEKGKRHVFGEAFRTLRSSILFMGQAEPRPNTFIITSAVPEEGKSTIASNLAISLAVASSRTLLVDADLRRGRLNRLFKMPNRNGLIEVLQGKMNLEDAIVHTEIENLDFIPRGQTVSNSGELLLSERMEEVIQTVKHSYDYVIFDAAPVLATDDTTSFASKVDAILYVVRSTTIRLRQVKVAIDGLKMRSANIAGFIMNFADTRGMDYYYYNKYQYYYRYQSQDVTSNK